MSNRLVFLRVTLIIAILFSSTFTASFAKVQQLQTEKVVIRATPETVFDALRKERDAPECQRKTLCFDGKVARIDELMHNVPIYGRVHFIWEETEFPYQKMDYRMLESNHFKSAHGSWVIVPSSNNNETTLELRSYVDTGLRIPFADQITQASAAENARERLIRIKNIAEKEAAQNKTFISSSQRSR